MSGDEDLSPKEAARQRARERKARPPKMVVDNAGVKRILLARAARHDHAPQGEQKAGER